MTKQRARTIGVVAGLGIGVLVAMSVLLAAVAPVSGMFLDDEESDGSFGAVTLEYQIPWWSEVEDGEGNSVGDPILIGTGQLRHQETDLEVASMGIPFRFTRVYRSKLGYNGPFGQNWDFTYNTRITVNASATSATLYDGTGREDVFNVNGGTNILFPAEKSRFEKLLNVSVSSVTTIERKTARPLWTWRYSNHDTGDLKHFRLVEIENNFQHKMTFEYGTDSAEINYRRLKKITDTEGGEYDVLYNTNGYISKLVDFASREICYVYDGPTGRLTKVKQPPPASGDPHITEYKYKTSTNLIEEVYSPEQPSSTGVPYIKNTYDGTTGRLTKQQAVSSAGAGGLGEYSLDYGTPGQVTVLNRANKKTVYHVDSSNRVTKTEVYEGATKHETERTYHTDGQIHQIKHPKDGSGNRRIETFTYSTDSDPIKKARLLSHSVAPATTAKSEATLTWTYGAYNDLWNVPTYVVDANGLETSLTISGSSPYTFTTKVGPVACPQSISVAEYDAFGRLALAKNLVTGSTYEETVFYYANTTTGLVSSIAVKDGGTPKLAQSFTYDDYRNLKTRTDSRSKTTTYNHDKRNNLTSIAYPDTNYTTTFEYNKDDRLVKRVVPVKPSVTRCETIDRDERGNVTSVEIEIDGSTTATRSTEYDKSERIEKVTDEDGREIKYDYNDRGYVEKVTFAPGKTEEATHLYFYDHEGRVTTFRDGRGNDWTTEYDGHGRVYKRTDPDGNYIVYSYWDGDGTGDGTLVKESKQYASGGTSGNEFRWTKYEYDHLLRTEKIEELAKDGPGGTNLGDGWQTTTYEYDLIGRATKILDELNKYTEFSYDDLGRLESREHETGNKVAFAYEQQTGLVSTKTLTEVVGASTKVTTQTFSYDDLGRPILQTDELGNPSTITYNFAGQVLTYKDQLANQVIHTYDRRGARTQTEVKEANGTSVQTVSFAHYASGLLKEAIDGTSKKTTYTYDNRARLTERKFLPDSTKYTWTYDDENNIKTMTDPRGTVFTYTYDDRGLATTIAYTGSFSDAGPVKYQYNAVGETTRVEDGDSLVTLARNTLGQVLSETQYVSPEAVTNTFGRTIASTFDAAGRRTALQYPTIQSTAFSLSYDYDSLYRLTTLKSSGNTVAAYTYAGFDRMTKATYGNNTKMTITHDNRGLVTDVLHQNSINQTLFEVNRLIDPAGRTTWRRQQYHDPATATTYYTDVARYYYDAASRMHCAYHNVTSPAWGSLSWNSNPTAASSKKIYTFTAADTRDSVTAIYYPNAPITENYSDNSNTHDYISATIDTLSHTMGSDASGNRTTHHIGTSNGYYGYDAFDRLVFAETDVGGGSATTIEWRHDGLGRTIEERVTNSSGTTITRYYHDGDSRVIEVTVPNDASYSNETKVRSYIFGADGPAPTFGRKWGGTNQDAYFHIDERGSVLGLTDTSQGVLEHYRYQKSALGITEARDYGEFTLHSGTSGTVATGTAGMFGNPFLWTGSPMSRGLFDAPGQRLLFVGHGAAYDPATGVDLQRSKQAAFGGRGHSVPTATPVDWGGGNPWGDLGIGAGWPGTFGPGDDFSTPGFSPRGGGDSLVLLRSTKAISGGAFEWYEKGFGMRQGLSPTVIVPILDVVPYHAIKGFVRGILDYAKGLPKEIYEAIKAIAKSILTLNFEGLGAVWNDIKTAAREAVNGNAVEALWASPFQKAARLAQYMKDGRWASEMGDWAKGYAVGQVMAEAFVTAFAGGGAAVGGAKLISKGMQKIRGKIESAVSGRRTQIPTINGRKPINSRFAGEVHPSGVRFSRQGFPIFTPWARAQVKLKGLTGKNRIDAARANKAAGFDSTPDGYVWHHVEDGVTMQLIPSSIHDAARHTGGAAVIRNGGRFDR